MAGVWLLVRLDCGQREIGGRHQMADEGKDQKVSLEELMVSTLAMTDV